ncbi:MAG: hypothetical protein ACP5O2_11125 [Bacteroidales bacterium]
MAMLQTFIDILLAILWLSMFLIVPYRMGLQLYSNTSTIIINLILITLMAILGFKVHQVLELNTAGYIIILAPLLLFFSALGRMRKIYILLWLLFWMVGVLLTGIIGFVYYARDAGQPLYTQGIIFLSTGVSVFSVIMLNKYQFLKIENQPTSYSQIIQSYLILCTFLIFQNTGFLYLVYALVAETLIFVLLKRRNQLPAYYPALVTTTLLSPGMMMESAPQFAILISLLSLGGIIWLTAHHHPSHFDPAWMIFIATAISGYIASLVYVFKFHYFNIWIMVLVLHAQVFLTLIFNFLFLTLLQFVANIQEKPVD